MAVKQRGKSWQVTVYIGGARRRKDCPTEQAAMELEAAWVAERDARGVTPVRAATAIPTALKGHTEAEQESLQGITLAALIKHCYAGRWEGTRAGRDQLLCANKAVGFFGENYLAADIVTGRVDQYRKWLTGTNTARGEKANTGATANRALTALSVVLTYGLPRGALRRRNEDGEIVSEMPVIAKATEDGIKRRTFGEDEYKATLKLLTHWGKEEMADAVILLNETGLRDDCELLRLEGPDIREVPSRHVYVKDGKFGKPRVVPLSDAAFAAAQRCIVRATAAGRAKLFSLSYGTLLHEWNRVRLHLKKSGDKTFVLHGWRHTCCTRWAMAGVPILTLQKWMGHATINTTMRYAHIAGDTLLEDAALVQTIKRF